MIILDEIPSPNFLCFFRTVYGQVVSFYVLFCQLDQETSRKKNITWTLTLFDSKPHWTRLFWGTSNNGTSHHLYWQFLMVLWVSESRWPTDSKIHFDSFHVLFFHMCNFTSTAKQWIEISWHDMKIHNHYLCIFNLGPKCSKKGRGGREMPNTFQFNMNQLVQDRTITSGKKINCHLMYVTNQFMFITHI